MLPEQFTLGPCFGSPFRFVASSEWENNWNSLCVHILCVHILCGSFVVLSLFAHFVEICRFGLKLSDVIFVFLGLDCKFKLKCMQFFTQLCNV